MRYLTEVIFKNLDNKMANSEQALKEAYSDYEREYKKAKVHLPDKFVKAYESHSRFHDAMVPEINLLTKYNILEKKKSNFDPSTIRLIIVDSNNTGISWEITLEDIKQVKSDIHIIGAFFKGIEFYQYDEILLLDNKYLSWEIHFSSDSVIEFIFGKLKIREIKYK